MLLFSFFGECNHVAVPEKEGRIVVILDLWRHGGVARKSHDIGRVT